MSPHYDPGLTEALDHFGREHARTVLRDFLRGDYRYFLPQSPPDWTQVIVAGVPAPDLLCAAPFPVHDEPMPRPDIGWFSSAPTDSYLLR